MTGIGETHEQKILDIIQNSSKTGLFPHELNSKVAEKRIALTRQGIHKICSRLMKGNLVYKKNGKYFATNFEFGTMINFADHLAEAGRTIIDSGLIDASDDTRAFVEGRYMPYDNLCKNVLGISSSQKYCEAKFSDQEINEKYLFEFANRVGALIAYTFMETMRPALAKYGENSFSEQTHNSLVPLMIERAMDLKGLYIDFCNLFNETGVIDKIHNENHKSYFHLDEEHFAKLASAFKNIYPGIFQALEEYWKDSVLSNMDFTKRIASGAQCKHKWDSILLYKIGIVYHCRLCGEYSDTRVMGRKFDLKKRKGATNS
jgi:hypothetical protein